jgi:hypothetical protein
MMTFFEIQQEFEGKISKPFELLECHYLGYAFGSGYLIYRINGMNIKFIYDGKDSILRVEVSPKQIKYPTDQWTEILNDRAETVLGQNFWELKEKIEE